MLRKAFKAEENAKEALKMELSDQKDRNFDRQLEMHDLQRVVIHYRFIGTLDMSRLSTRDNIRVDTRQGVAVNYLSSYVTA